MENNNYKTPESNLVIEKEDVVDSITASRKSRLGAALIDMLTILPITMPLMYFTGGFDGIEAGAQPTLAYTLIMALIGIVLFIVIHGKFLISNGQTIG